MKRAWIGLLAMAGVILGLSAAPATAQLPVGWEIFGAFTSGGLVGGLQTGDPVGMVSGAVGGTYCGEVNAVAFDPYSGDIFVGGIGGGACPGPGQIRRLTWDGSGGIASETLLATMPTGASSTAGLEVDLNGDLIGSGGANAYRVTRGTWVVTQLNLAAFPGTANDVEVAPDGKVYVGVTGIGNVYELDGAGNQNFLGTVGGISSSTTISGVTVNAANTKLWACTFGTLNPIVEFDLTAAPPVLGVGIPTLVVALNDVEFDRRPGVNRAYACSAAGGTDFWYILDTSTSPPTQVGGPVPALFPWGVYSQIDVNDYQDRLTCFPRTMSASAGGTFEIGLGGVAGDIGVIAITAPTITILSIGPFTTPDGRLRIAPIPVAPGLLSPGAITLGFARITPPLTLSALNLAAVTVTITP